MSHAAIMMSLETMIDPKRAKGMKARLGFRLGEAAYAGRLKDGRLEIKRRQPEDSHVVFTASPTELAAVIYGGAPLSTIGVEGDVALAERFITLFPLPPKAG